MKKHLIIALFIPIATFGQRVDRQAAITGVNGNISMPALMSLDIIPLANQSLSIQTFPEISDGKVYRAYVKLKVKSNSPWVITVRADNRYLSSGKSIAGELPAGTFYLKQSGSSNYVLVSNSAQPLIYSNNDLIENEYYIDLKVGPSFDYRGGQYDFNLVFTILPR